MKRLYCVLFITFLIWAPIFYYLVPKGQEWTNMGQNDLRNIFIFLSIYPLSRILGWITVGITNLFFPEKEKKFF